MKLIAHRINSLKKLEETPTHLGVEIDLRDYRDDLVLAHDPYTGGETTFKDFLRHYHHDLLVLNVKSEGIEYRARELAEQAGVQHFVFLDSSIPMMVKLTEQKETRFAVRFSEFEPLEGVLRFQGRCDFVWVDQFHQLELRPQDAQKLRQAGFRLIFVSPELQGRDPNLEMFRGISLDGDYLCTKIIARPESDRR